MIVGTGVNIDGFLAYLSLRVSPSSARLYGHHVGMWLRTTTDDSPASAQAFLDRLTLAGKKANTVNTYANAFKRYFRHKGLHGVVLESPALEFPDPEYLLPKDVDRLIGKGCRDPLTLTLVVLLYDTGCRISEVLGLTLTDIDWEEGMVEVTRKGGRRGSVNVSIRGMGALQRWLSVRKGLGDKKVFMGLDYPEARELIMDAGRRAGLGHVTPHMLRHSRAVQMLLAGADWNVIKEHLGHMNIGTTMNIYARLKPAHLKDKIPEW